MIPYAIQSLIVRPEIKTTKDLTGKNIGVSRLGAIPHFTLQAITKLYNVQGINVVQTGTTTQGITSLSQGLIDGVITSAPNTFRLMKDGYRELVSPKDFRKLNFEFLINGLVARRSFGAKNRDTVIGMIKATMEGVKVMSTQEALAKTILSKYTRLTQPELLDRLYKFAVDAFRDFARDPNIPREAIASMARLMGEFGIVDRALVAGTPTEAFYDNSYVDEIKQSGFLKELWK
jgi:hypothetical protein